MLNINTPAAAHITKSQTKTMMATRLEKCRKDETTTG